MFFFYFIIQIKKMNSIYPLLLNINNRKSVETLRMLSITLMHKEILEHTICEPLVIQMS